MICKLVRTYIFISLFINSNFLLSQNLSTQGKDFWMAYLPTLMEHKVSLTLLICSESQAHGIVSLPNKSWTKSFEIDSSGFTTIEIPFNLGSCQTGGISNIGIHIQSDETVTVYAINNQKACTDGTVVYPKNSLGISYSILSYDFTGYLIVATENQTVIEISPQSSGSTPFTIQLDTGEVYYNGSYSNVSIRSLDECKPIAVFAGNAGEFVPPSVGAADHLYEQMPPINEWGKEFIAVPFEGKSVYIIKIASSEDSTNVILNSDTIRLNKGEYFLREYVTGPTYIRANNPILVAQIMMGYFTNEPKGDPSLMILNPNNLTIDKIKFVPNKTPSLDELYLAVIMKSSFVSQLTINKDSVGNQLIPIDSCPGYSFKAFSIDSSIYSVKADSGFIAYIYGYGYTEGYSYSAGFSKRNFYDFEVDTIVCEDALVNFKSDGINNEFLVWDFGDGGSGTGRNPSHIYTGSGNFMIKLHISDNKNECSYKDYVIDKELKVNKLPEINLGNDTLICDTTSVVLAAAADYQNYKWSTGDTTRKISINSTGVYSVQIYDGNCYNSDSVKVSIGDLPDLLVKSDKDTLTYNESTHFNSISSGAVSWLWDFGDGNVSNSESPNHTFKHEGHYNVTNYVTKVNGCVFKDSVSIFVLPIFFVPNLFTPNGDGKNDGFNILFNGNLDYELTIYNRWGNKLFYSNDPSIVWEGANAPNGIYYYSLKIGKNIYKGSVELLR